MATRVAIVTGGTRGIGSSVAKHLISAGYKVAVTYVSHDEKAASFEAETGVRAYKWNASSVIDSADGIKLVEKEIGPIDTLVNNAGITRDSVLHRMSEDQWDSVIETNLKSCFAMCRAVIEGMRARNFGRIINITSINGQRGQFGQVNYSAAKAGMIGFTKALAFENATKGITVNCIAPGYIGTDMVFAVPEEIINKIIAQIPVGHLGDTDDVGRAVLFLADKAQSFITGATITINGGHYMA